jgi:hypothetical protein
MDIEHIHLPAPLRSVELGAAALPPKPPERRGSSATPAAGTPALETEAAAFAGLFSAFKFQLQELERRRQQSLWEMQVAALELAVAAAAQLLMKAVEAGDYPVEEIVRNAIDQLEPRRPIVIVLHPADRQLLETRLAQLPDAQLPAGCELRSDPKLRRGDCRAELADSAGVVRNAAALLNDIHRAWLEELDEAQIERRTNDASGHKLQRFPDRRDTA